MVTWAVEPLKSTILEGSIVARVVLLVGVVLLAYGLVQFVPVVSALVANFTTGEAQEILNTSILSFLSIGIGFVVVVLSVALDFE